MIPYATRMEQIKTQLQTIAPGSAVTRTYRDHGQRTSEDLAAGIFTIVSSGVTEYASIEPPGDFGRQRVLIIWQGKVAEDATGEDLEAAEYAAMNQLEQLAAEHDPVITPELILKSAETSMQLEAPYAWVASEWELWVDPNP